MCGPGWTIKLERVTPVAGRAAWKQCEDTLSIAEAYADAPFAHVRVGRIAEDQAFACRHCGEACGLAAGDGTGAICEGCCATEAKPDDEAGHVFEYVEGERRHACRHCDAEPPHDWYDRD